MGTVGNVPLSFLLWTPHRKLDHQDVPVLQQVLESRMVVYDPQLPNTVTYIRTQSIQRSSYFIQVFTALTHKSHTILEVDWYLIRIIF